MKPFRWVEHHERILRPRFQPEDTGHFQVTHGEGASVFGERPLWLPQHGMPHVLLLFQDVGNRRTRPEAGVIEAVAVVVLRVVLGGIDDFPGHP